MPAARHDIFQMPVYTAACYVTPLFAFAFMPTHIFATPPLMPDAADASAPKALMMSRQPYAMIFESRQPF